MHWKTHVLPLVVLALAATGCKSGSEDAGTPRPAPAAASAPAEPAKPAEAPRARPAEVAPTAKTTEVVAAPVSTTETAPMANGKLLAEVGKLAPNFELVDLDGKKHSLSQYRGKTVVLEWFSPGCPACKYGYSKGPFTTMPEAYQKAGMVWLSVNSEAPENDAAKPKMNRDFVEKYKMEAPILFDPTGVVGRSYGAKSTPHMFVIDPKGVLVYRGAIDNAPGGQVDGGKPMINYVDAAVADMKAGRPVATAETTSYG